MNLLLLLSANFVIPLSLAQQCYLANGTATPRSDVSPCPNTPVTSICCSLNRTNPSGGDQSLGWTRDECLSNGLCQNRYTFEGQNTTAYWVEYCTDANLASGKCLDVCRETRDAEGATQITPCDGKADGERWCCGTTTTCCTNDYGVVLLPREFTGKVISSSSASASGTGAASTPTLTPSTSSERSDEGGLSTGAKAGIGIGAAAGALAVLALIAFFLRRARMAKKEKRNGSKQEISSVAYPYNALESDLPVKSEHAGTEIAELPYNSEPSRQALPSELPETSVPVELPGAEVEVEPTQPRRGV